MSVSAEEVAKHNTDKDCWVIVGDQVLDVTNFLSRSDGEVHVARIVSL
jgi:cytochrome b involved in lipid metabolism